MNTMITEETLTAYVLGELSGAERAGVEAALGRDPALAAKAAALGKAASLSTMALAGRADVSLTDAQRAAVMASARSSAGPDSPFDMEVDDSEFDLPVSTPSMVGERGESSNLFSLTNLQSLDSDAEAGAEGGARGHAFTPGDEASGLIDIRKMAGELDLSDDKIAKDELLGIGSHGFAPVLGAPVLPLSRREGGLWVKVAIGAGALVAVACAVVVIVVVGGEPKGAQEAAAGSDEQIALLMKELEELKKTGAAEDRMEQVAEQLEAERAKADEAAAADEAEGKPKAKDSSKGKGPAKAGAKSAGSSDLAATESASKASTGGGSSAGATAKGGKAVSELDDLLGGSTKAPPKKAEESKPAASGGGGALPATLSRSQVQSGMSKVAVSVKACGQGKGGTITMDVTISNAGTVSSVSATGAHAGTTVGSCAARAVKRARFPRFKNPNLKVKYPFAL